MRRSKSMSDYINREDAIDAACANCIYDEFLSDRKKRIKEGITEIPPADVVEVVRCKDCKCCEERRTANYLPFYYCLRIDSSVKDNDYCSYGERKDNECE